MDKPVGRLAVLGWSLGYVLLVNAGLLVIAHAMFTTRTGLNLFLMFVANAGLVLFPLLFGSEKVGGRGLFVVPIVLYIGYTLYYFLFGGHLPKLFELQETPVIPVKEAPGYPDYDVYHLADGHVESRYVQSRTFTNRRGRKIHYYVAPVVPEGWTKGDRITLWVGQLGVNPVAPASWSQPLRGGRDVAEDQNLRELVDEDATKQGLQSTPHVAIISWSEHPREELQRIIQWELWLLIGADLLALLAFQIRGKPEPAPAAT